MNLHRGAQRRHKVPQRTFSTPPVFSPLGENTKGGYFIKKNNILFLNIKLTKQSINGAI
jgi:hypothetical protein